MNKEIEKIKNITEYELPEIKTLFIVLLIFLAIIIASNGTLSEFLNLISRAIIYLLVVFSWIIFWFFNKYVLPRNKKNKVGIVIAIYSENEIERQKLKSDFLSKLFEDFRNEGIIEFSNIIPLKNHFSKLIKDSNNQRQHIEKINKKIKAHFFVWGDIRKRSDGNEGDKYFMNFEGLVVHKPISLSLSQKISKEFSKVLPREVNFFENRSFKWFGLTEKLVSLATKYVIGIAAFVSQDPILALKLHSRLKEQFAALSTLPPHYADIKNRIPLFISDEALWISKWHYINKRFDDSKKFINQSLIENSNNYAAWLFKAIIDFKIDGNITESFKSLKKAERYANGNTEWLYSKAFLFFWNGDYKNALKICLKIKQRAPASRAETIAEIRAFNLELLSQPSPKAQLYFWIGYLSYFQDNNIANALLDFENFEKFSTPEMSILEQKSSAYLCEIMNQMGIKK
jgi:hypothetical protein